MAENDENYSAYLTANLEEYKGKWIILCDEHVIASGDDIKDIVKKAQTECPHKKFLLARVPEEGTMIL
ncbi:MAG: succinyl-CoA synthetase subunit alpha [Phycisphaerae bacterium]|nr:succinyl-CoA synthetase subunit alpha [Phycisphaerae bacterium]MBI9019040.1 succinyl-CoA synthetase subunit alpha [Phycisphaerae bacterium]